MAGGNSRQQIEEALGLKDAYSSLKQIEAVIPQILDGFKNIATTSKDISTSLGGKNTLKEIVQMSKLSAQQAKAYADEQKALLDVESRIIQQLEKEARTRKAETDAITAQTKASKEATNALIAEERAKQSMLRTEQMANKAKEASTKLTGEAARIAKLQEQLNSSLEGSYNRLNAQYQLNVIELNKMTKEQRENTEAGKMLTKQTAELYAQLGRLDESTGRHQRSVGNYAKAFNGLQFQMQQIAREAPSLAYGPQMFIAAISNNLPMLQDEIAKTRIENERLKASGEKSVPVWKQMAMGLLSWQTAAVVLVTTYMLFSKQINTWIAGIFKGREAIDVLKKSQEEYNKAVVEGIGNAQKDVTTLNLLYNAARDVNKSMEERNIAVQKLQEMYPKYFGNMDAEIIKAGDAGKAYEVLKNRIIEASKARAFSDQIAENTKKMEVDLQPQIDKKLQELDTTKKELDRLKTSYDQASRIDPETAPAVMMALAKKEEQYKRLGGEVQALAEEYDVLDEANKRLEKGINISSLYDEPIAKDTTRGLGGNKYTELERMQDLHKRQLEETATYQQQLLGQQEYTADQIARIEADNAKELLIQRLAQIDEEKKIKELSVEQLAALDVEYAETNKELQKTMTDYAIEEGKRLFKERQDEAKRVSDLAIDESNTRMVQGEIDLNNQARLNIDKIKNEKDVADKIRDIQLQLSLDILEMRKKELQAVLNSGKLTVDDAKKVKEQIEKIDVALSEGKLKQSADTTKGLVKVDKERLRELADAVNAGADFVLTTYDRQLAYAEDTYDKEVKAAGDSVEGKILAERKFEEEQKKIRRKQDLAERAQALFNIWLSLLTATAELSPLKIAAATFASAAVLARPVPQYAKGTRSHGGGLAIVGEEGRELVTEPDGRTWLTENTASVYDLSKGASVLPADRTLEYLQKYSVSNDAKVFVDMSTTNRHLETIANNTKSRVENQYDLSGRLIVSKKGNTTIHYTR